MIRHASMLGCIGLVLVASTARAQGQSVNDLQSTAISVAQETEASVFLDVQGCGLSVSMASGVADRVTRSVPTIDMQLRLASVGKLYTAAVIHRLAARGLLDLDAPASRYLKADDAVGVANRAATLRQLLNHTSGVPDYYALPDIEQWNWQMPFTPERVLSAIKSVKPTGTPGSTHSYSNSGYHLLALAAERATNQSFADLIQAEVLVPADLSETRYNLTAPGGPLHGYVGKKDWWDSAENTGPDGGVTATLADVRKYLRALFFDAGPMRATGRAMTENPVETGKPLQRHGAGAQMRISQDGLRLVGHTGSIEGYLSFAYIAPEYGLTMIGHITASDKDAFTNLLTTTAQIAQAACSSGPGRHSLEEK